MNSRVIKPRIFFLDADTIRANYKISFIYRYNLASQKKRRADQFLPADALHISI